MAIRKRNGRASSYQVYWNNPFTEKRESVSFPTLAEARKEDSLIQHRLKYDRESFRPAQEENISTGGTVREVVALYLSAKKFSGKNLRTMLEHLKHVHAVFGNREVSSLEKRDFIKFISDEAERGVKTTTSHRRLTILRAALSWAADSEFIESNPMQGMKLPRGQHERIAPPTPAEASAILAVAKGHVYRAVMLGIFLGVRIGPTELFRLKWQDVDFERRTIRVWSAAKNKNQAYRDVPIRESLLKEMKDWVRPDTEAGYEFIVHFKGKPIASMKTAWRDTKKAAGITRRMRPYDLRHAFATYALDNDADLKSVVEIMGHSNPTMILTHYQHTSEASRRAAIESFPDITPSCAQGMCPKK